MLDPDQNGNNQSLHINNVNSLYTTNRGNLLYWPPLFFQYLYRLQAFLELIILLIATLLFFST